MDEVDTAISTSKNLPNPPAGARTAAISPPMSLPSLNPVDHDGTPGAAAANAAPIIFHAIYKIWFMNQTWVCAP